MKRYLSLPPILVAPRPKEPLFLYVAATNQTVSGVLVAEREQEQAKPKEGTLGVSRKPRVVQFPVYYVSSMLRDARERYPEIVKILLGFYCQPGSCGTTSRHIQLSSALLIRSSVCSPTHMPRAEWRSGLWNCLTSISASTTVRPSKAGLWQISLFIGQSGLLLQLKN